jgi:DNA-binding transcriptional LysR family regulator
MLTPVNLSTIDTNLLLVLHRVMEHESVAAAARALHVTPSAISNALARLRKLVGDPLFVRRGRGLVPTPRALALAPELKVAFDGLERALAAGRFDARTSSREFKVCLADGDQIATLPRLADAFVRAMPCARLTAVSVDTLVASGGLASGSADVAVSPLLEETDVHALPLYDDEAVLLVRRDHPRVRRKMSAEQFCRERHVDTHLALGRPGIGHRAAEDVFARHALTREVAVAVPTFAAAAMVAAQSDLIAAMPRRVAEMLAVAAPLRILESPMPPLRFTMHLVWHARTHRDAGARSLRELMVAELGAKRPRRTRASLDVDQAHGKRQRGPKQQLRRPDDGSTER